MIKLNPFVCGAFLEEQEESECFSPSSTPRSRSKCCKRSKTTHRDAKNPYSARGLDKFSALLADLEAKREKIYAQIGPDSLVRFIYPNSNDCIPIVIKPKDKQMTLSNKQQLKPQPQPQQQFSSPPLADTFRVEAPPVKVVKEEKRLEKVKKQRFRQLAQLRRPCYYMPLVVIMILMMLMVVGRSVAILCVSFAWYLVPMISPEVPIIAKNKASITKKKELGRRWSDNRMMVVRKGMSPPRVSKMSASAAVTRSSSPQHLRYGHCCDNS